MDVAEVLEKAHDELLIHGWCQGNYRVGERMCALGAIEAVSGEAWVFDSIAAEAAQRLCEAIPAQDGTVGDWNDAPERTIDDVLDAFRHAAKNEREKAGQQ